MHSIIHAQLQFNMNMKIHVLIFACAFTLGWGASSPNKAVYCYFGSWSTYRHGNGHFDVEDIDPFLCTHAAFGFAGLNRNTYEIRVLDPWNELETNYGKGAYNRFTKLKLINPNLKTLLSVGGDSEGDNKNLSIAVSISSVNNLL